MLGFAFGRAHFLYRRVQRCFIHLTPMPDAQTAPGQAMLPQADCRSGEIACRYFQVAVILGIEHEHAAEVARVATDQQGIRPVSRRDPGAQCRAEVGQMINL